MSHEELLAEVRRAEDLGAQGRYDLALQAFTDVLRRRLAEASRGPLALTAADAAVMERTADLAAGVGVATAASDLLQAVVSLCGESGNVEAADHAALRRVSLLLDAGDLRAAGDALECLAGPVGDVRSIAFEGDGLAAFEAGCWPVLPAESRLVLLALFWYCVGRLLAGLGQYDASVAALGRALNRARAGSVAGLAPAMRLALTQSYIEAGRLTLARDQLAEDEEEASRAPRANPLLEVARLSLSGRVATIEGRYGAALAALERTVDRSQSLGLVHAGASTALDLAQLKILLNQTRAARQILADLAPVLIQLGDQALTFRATCLDWLARARVQSMARGVGLAPGELWSPPPDEEASGAAYEPDDPWGAGAAPASFLALFEDRAMIVHWRLGRGDVEGAARAVGHMAQVFAGTDSVLLRARLTALQGLVAYYQRDYAHSERSLREAADALQDVGARPELWQTVRVLTWARARLGGNPDEIAQLRNSADAHLREMAESLPAVERAMYLLNKWSATDEARASVVDALVRLKQRSVSPGPRRFMARAAMLWRLASLLAQLDEDRQGFLATIAGGTGGGHARRGLIPFLRLLASCPADRVILAFLALPDRLLIVRRLAWEMDFIVVPVTLPALRALVRDCHEAVHEHAGTTRDLAASPAGARDVDGGRLRRAFAALCDTLRLQELLSGLPATITALTVAPDDVLHGCPFAALPMDGGFLIERFAISLSYEYSARHRAPRTKGDSALLVAVSAGTTTVPALPGASREIDRVQQALEHAGLTVRRLSGDQVTCDGLRGEMERAGLVHLACHGTFEADRPDRIGLVLVRDGRSEILSLKDLAAADFSAVAHVTLSSCWSADQFVFPGHWIIGLPEVLWRRGVDTVLGSMWPVDDDTAAELVSEFQRLALSSSPEAALQQVQLGFLRRAARPGASPAPDAGGSPDARGFFHWAGFRLCGSGPGLPLRSHLRPVGGRGTEAT